MGERQARGAARPCRRSNRSAVRLHTGRPPRACHSPIRRPAGWARVGWRDQLERPTTRPGDSDSCCVRSVASRRRIKSAGPPAGPCAAGWSRKQRRAQTGHPVWVPAVAFGPSATGSRAAERLRVRRGLNLRPRPAGAASPRPRHRAAVPTCCSPARPEAGGQPAGAAGVTACQDGHDRLLADPPLPPPCAASRAACGSRRPPPTAFRLQVTWTQAPSDTATGFGPLKATFPDLRRAASCRPWLS